MVPMSNDTKSHADKKMVFVSYSHENPEWMATISRMLRGLQTSGIIEPFDDRLIAIGKEWDATIKAKLDEADLVILIVTFDFLGSTYINQVEIDRALQRHEEHRACLLPIIAEECDWDHQNWAKIDAWPTKDSKVLPLAKWDDKNAALTQISKDIRKWAATWRPVCPVSEGPPPADLSTPPYRGLLAFQPEDKEDYFGREALTDTLWTAVCTNRLTLLRGGSGSGKSSLINAGLLPSLKAEECWSIARLRPGATPIVNLASALARAMLPGNDPFAITDRAEDLAAKLAQDPTRLLNYATTHHELNGKALFLVVDQLEETFNLALPANPDQHRQLMTMLCCIATATGEPVVKALLAMRADFQAELQNEDPPLVRALDSATVSMTRMTDAELALSIQAPAQRRGVSVEPALLARLLSDVGRNPDALPLVEVMLETLWAGRPSDTLTFDAYEKQGGLAGALASRGDAAIADPAIDEERARRLFLELVHVDSKGGIDNVTRQPRSRAHLDSIDPDLWELGRTLASERHRLLVTSRDDATGTETLDIIHEALFRQWPRLARWIEAEREFLLFCQRLDQRLADYAASDGYPAYFLPPREIEQANDWQKMHGKVFRTELQNFIAASTRHWQEDAADDEARELWGLLDFRPPQSGDILDRDEHNALLRLAQSSFLTRQKFLQLAINNEEYAKKFNRQPYFVMRSAVILDEKLACSLISIASNVKLDPSCSEARLARLAILLLVLPLKPDLAKFLLDEVRPQVLKPSEPEQSISRVIADVIFAVLGYIEESVKIDLLHEAVSIVNRLDNILEASGPLQVVKAIYKDLGQSQQKNLIIKFLERLKNDENLFLIDHIVWMAEHLARKNAQYLDVDVAQKMVDIFENANQLHYSAKILPALIAVLNHLDCNQKHSLLNCVAERFEQLASEQDQPHSLATVLANLPQEFPRETLTKAAATLFESAAAVLASTKDSADFRQAIITMAVLVENFRLPISVVEANCSFIDRALEWMNKSADIDVLVAIVKLSKLKRIFDSATIVTELRRQILEFLFDYQTRSWRKWSIEAFNFILRNSCERENEGLFTKMMNADFGLLRINFDAPEKAFISLVREAEAEFLSKFFGNLDSGASALTVQRLSDPLLRPSLPILFNKIGLEAASQILNMLIDDININEHAGILIEEQRKAVYYLSKLDSVLSEQQKKVIGDIIVADFSEWLRANSSYWDARERIAGLTLVVRSNIGRTPMLFILIEALKRPLSGDPDSSEKLLVTIGQLLGPSDQRTGLHERTFWRVIGRLAELKADNPDWDWLDLARPPLPPDDLLATFRRLCADPPDWPAPPAT
jgi:hypothetical protein